LAESSEWERVIVVKIRRTFFSQWFGQYWRKTVFTKQNKNKKKTH